MEKDKRLEASEAALFFFSHLGENSAFLASKADKLES